MSSARRYRKALKVVRQHSQEEAMTRFEWLVGGVMVFEFAFALWWFGLVRPLG